MELTEDKSEITRLLRAYHERGDASARERLVELHMPLVEKLARGLPRGSSDLDDLVQVGSIGLMKAIDRFELARGQSLDAYAVPTITGEMKRHLRDADAPVRVPQQLQETSARVRTSQGDLGARLGRAPTTAELARELDIEEDEVASALASERARVARSLPSGGETTDGTAGVDLSEDRLFLTDALRTLSDEERQIIYMRFIRGVSRTETARELGMSARQLARRQGKAVARLKRELEGSGEPEPRLAQQGKRPRVDDVAGMPASEVARLLELPYHVVLVRNDDATADKRWKASVEELPGCEAAAPTSEEAAAAIGQVMESWLAEALEKGAAVPQPRTQSKSSGRLLLRMPQSLHAELARRADREEVSLNGFITAVLASAVGWQRDGSGPKSTVGVPTPAGASQEADEKKRPRFLSVAIVVNVVVLAIAAVAAVILVILALHQGL